MLGRTLLGALCAIAATVGVVAAPRAQTWQDIAATEDWQHDFTVLTMAPDGSWGTATETFINQAIAGAIRNCRAMSGAELGCGAYFSSIRAGWSLGFRCGNENIVVAEKTLADAERRAIRREAELREHYVRDMPPCVRVVTVDPNGLIVPSQVGYSGQISTSQ
jgi:hypothetical protein